jgi:hypothetical protein
LIGLFGRHNQYLFALAGSAAFPRWVRAFSSAVSKDAPTFYVLAALGTRMKENISDGGFVYHDINGYQFATTWAELKLGEVATKHKDPAQARPHQLL